MSDSQNWSSFEEEEEAIKPKRTTTSSNENEKHHDNTITAATTRFDMRQFKNRLVFGGLVGFCTGATFGTIDAMKMYHQQHKRIALAGFNTFARGAAMTGASFSGFFLSYQGAKTVIEAQRGGKDDLFNVGAATVIAGLPFLRVPVMRHNVPYALMLVVLDHFHEEINAARK